MPKRKKPKAEKSICLFCEKPAPKGKAICSDCNTLSRKKSG
jgi:predicted nucleic acid-binding Zn ribbon protein